MRLMHDKQIYAVPTFAIAEYFAEQSTSPSRRESLDFHVTQFRKQLAAGVPMDVIAQAMGHKPGSKITASVYALADEELKREAIAATAQRMLSE